MKKLSVKLGSHSIDSTLEGPIDDVITFLQNKKKEYEDAGFKNIRMEFNTEYGYYDEQWVEVTYYGDQL